MNNAHNNPHFTPANKRLAWDTGRGVRWSQTFTPSQEAIAWDGAHEETNMAVWSDVAECYVYVVVTITGRKLTGVFGSRSDYGTRVNVTFGKGTEDETSAKGWIV